MSNGIVIPSATELEQTLRNLDNYVRSGLASGTVSSKIKEMKGKLHEIFVLQGMTGAEIAHLRPIFDIPLFFWGFLKAWKEVKQVGRTEDFLQQHLRNMATFDNTISAPIPRPLLSSKEKELPSEKLHLPTIQYGKANNSELTMRSGGAEERMAHSRRPSSRTRSPSLQQDVVDSLRQSPPARTLSPQNVQIHPEKIPEVPSTPELQPFVFPKGVIPVLRVPRDHGRQVFTQGRRGAADDMSYRGQKSSSESNSEREISPIDSAGHEEDEKVRPQPEQGRLNRESCDRCIKAQADCYDRARGRGACYRCSRQKVKCSLGPGGVSNAIRSRSRSRNQRMKHPPAVMRAREDQSAIDKRDGDNDGEVPTVIRRKPRRRRLPKSTEQHQPAGTSGRPLNVESAVTDEDCAPRFSTLEKGKHRAMGEDNDDEDLVARVDALTSKVVTATTTASTALLMVYDCNEACAQMEQSAAHGPNAKLGDRVTQLERKIDNVFEKLTHFEDRYLDIMQVLRSIQGTLLPVGGQAIARPYGLTVEMQVDEEIQTELKERLRSGPTTQQSVPFMDNSATGQVVDYQSSAPIPTTPDDVTNPMYAAPNSAEGAAAPVGTETIWSEHDAAKGQQLDLSSVRSTIVPSIQLIPPTPNNSQEQASYSTIMIVDGTPMEPIPISVQSAQPPAETTSSKLYPAIGNVDGRSEEKNVASQPSGPSEIALDSIDSVAAKKNPGESSTSGLTNIGPVASQQTDGVSDPTGLTAAQPTFPPPLTSGPNTIGHKTVPGESSTSGANILDIIVSEQHNPVSDPTKSVAAEPILRTLLTSGPNDTDSFISHPSPALDSSCSTTVNPTQVTSPTSGPHTLGSDIPQPAPSSLLVIPSASLLAPPLVHDRDIADLRRSPRLASPSPSRTMSRSPTPGHSGKRPRAQSSATAGKNKKARL